MNVAALPNRPLSSPGQLHARLQDIEQQLGEVQNHYEDCTGTHAEAKWDMEVEMAAARLDQTGTIPEKKDKALVAVAKNRESDFRKFVTAESQYLAAKVLVESLLSERASILQSLLKSQGRA